MKADRGWTKGSLTLDKHSRQVLCDVLGDPQGVPGVNGPVWKNDSAGADVIAAIILIRLGHGGCQQLCTDVEKLFTLFHLKPKNGKSELHEAGRKVKQGKRRGLRYSPKRKAGEGLVGRIRTLEEAKFGTGLVDPLPPWEHTCTAFVHE